MSEERPENQTSKPEISRRKVLLVGLATTPVIFSLFSRSAYSNDLLDCSVVTSILNITSLHPGEERPTEGDINRCENSGTDFN